MPAQNIQDSDPKGIKVGMLINSVMELAIISIISKDRQEISHSQWLALPQGWHCKLSPWWFHSARSVIAFDKVDPEGLACCIPMSLPSETGESGWGEGALPLLVALWREHRSSQVPGISQGKAEPAGTCCSGGDGGWEQEPACQEALRLLCF